MQAAIIIFMVLVVLLCVFGVTLIVIDLVHERRERKAEQAAAEGEQNASEQEQPNKQQTEQKE